MLNSLIGYMLIFFTDCFSQSHALQPHLHRNCLLFETRRESPVNKPSILVTMTRKLPCTKSTFFLSSSKKCFLPCQIKRSTLPIFESEKRLCWQQPCERPTLITSGRDDFLSSIEEPKAYGNYDLKAWQVHCIPHCNSEGHNQQVQVVNGKEPVSGIVRYNTRLEKRSRLAHSCHLFMSK